MNIERFTLRRLSLPTRLMLAAFLISVGIGYLSALVQLHFQHAPAGKLLPDGDDATTIYSGGPRSQSQLERLLVADVSKPFNGSGSMRQTFTERSAGWKTAINRRAKAKQFTPARAEAELRQEREGERLAILHWIRSGAPQAEFEANRLELPAALANHAITEEFVEAEDQVRTVKIATIFENRCARCHATSTGGPASLIPLENWEQINEFCLPETNGVGSGISLTRLAQTTHIHLLGLGMLYGLTGLIVSLTSYPGWLRGVLAPLPLIVQFADIGCWWLARLDPAFALLIPVTGSIVAFGLVAQISLSLFDLFGKTGKLILAAVCAVCLAGGVVACHQLLHPYLAYEETNPAASR